MNTQHFCCCYCFISYQTVHADNNFCIIYDTFNNFIDFFNFVIDNIHADKGSIDFRREPQITANLLLFVNDQNYKKLFCRIQQSVLHAHTHTHTRTRKRIRKHTCIHISHSPDSEAK